MTACYPSQFEIAISWHFLSRGSTCVDAEDTPGRLVTDTCWTCLLRLNSHICSTSCRRWSWKNLKRSKNGNMLNLENNCELLCRCTCKTSLHLDGWALYTHKNQLYQGAEISVSVQTRAWRRGTNMSARFWWIQSICSSVRPLKERKRWLTTAVSYIDNTGEGRLWKKVEDEVSVRVYSSLCLSLRF